MSRTARCNFTRRASNERPFHIAQKITRTVAIAVATACFALSLGPALLRAADTDSNSIPTSTTTTETNNNQETLRAYLQLQEQLQLTQLAIAQNRKEARETAAQNADLLANRLQVIEKALESQRAQEIEAMQNSNRTMLILAGTFAAIGFLAMLLMSFFQWRTVSRLAEISAALPATLALGPGPARASLGGGDSHLVSIGPADQSSLRLLGAVEQLEKRLYELEHSTRIPLKESTSSSNGGKISSVMTSDNGGATVISAPAQTTNLVETPSEASRASALMGKGQSMLNLDDAQAALICFEEVLAIEPNNAEAWIRKGTALERLQRLDQAVDCYDHAIAADGSMTIAYLHKGGLFNRMERFTEALECYEKALRTQEKAHA